MLGVLLMALSNSNHILIKSYDKCTPLYSDTLSLSFIYRLLLKNPNNFKRSSFYSKLINLSISIHYYYKEEKEG